MKISYTPVGSASVYTAVFSEYDTAAQSFDGSILGAGMPDYSPGFTQEVQEESTVLSGPRFRQPLANVKAVLQFTVINAYATKAAAKQAIRTWKAAFLNATVNLKVEEGLDADYYPNAVLTDARFGLQGANLTIQLSFSSDDSTTTQP